MSLVLPLPQRLMIGADFKPDRKKQQGRQWVRDQFLKLCEELARTGIVFKMNSVLRDGGYYNAIKEVREFGLIPFADLKLCDIDNTLETDGLLLEESNPAFLTVMCGAGVKAMKALKAKLPNTEVLGVTVLTSQTEAEADTLHGCSLEKAVVNLAQLAAEASLNGVVCSSKEVPALRDALEGTDMTFNVAAIRPEWHIVQEDDQNPERIATPSKAIKLGATRVIMARPILESTDRYSAVMRTLEEVDKALQLLDA